MTTYKQRSGGERRRARKLPRSGDEWRRPRKPPRSGDEWRRPPRKPPRQLSESKWKPGPTPPPPSVEFSEGDWAAIYTQLPAAAPAPENAKARLEDLARQLWDSRSGRIKQMSAQKLRKLLGNLSTAAKTASDWPSMATRIEILVQEVWHEQKLAGRYRGQCDPDRERFLYDVMQTYGSWGGILSNGNKRYVSASAKRFICAVAAAAREPVRPTSIGKVWARFRCARSIA
jgi:hypothetical protein